MNDNDGTITSSPARTPTAMRARCSPVVQELTATPWLAPTRSANLRSNSATRGPCATQPERTASAAARASSSPSMGSITWMRRWPVISAPPLRRARRRSYLLLLWYFYPGLLEALGAPPCDEVLEATGQLDLGVEAETLFCGHCGRQAPGHAVHRPGLTVF